jgi:CheY-like chemotaxis protein/signal transduction histidine kinase
MSTAQFQDLQHQHRRLLRTLQLPDTVLRPDTPPLFKRLDLQAARQLLQVSEAWSEHGVFEESERLVQEVLQKSAEGRHLYLAAELDLLQRIAETGEDQLHRGPFGMLELVLPVKVRGHHVHLLRSGKFREEPFREATLKEIAFTTGVSLDAVKVAAQGIPVRGGETLASFTALYKRLRDALAAALENQLQVSVQQIRTDPADGLASLGAVAEGAAHQFSNLLSVILGYSSLVLAKTDLPAEAMTALNRVSEAAQKGRRLTEELLAIAGSQREEDPSCSLHDRLTNALALLQADNPNATYITLDLQATHDQVPVAPGTLHAVAANLLSHALEGAAKGAKLKVVTQNHSENGVEQISAEVTEVGKDAKSADSAVRILFPVVSEPLSRAEKKVKRRLAPSDIWVADDDPNVREMCQRVLSADGHTVGEATSGEDLQRKLEAAPKPPDLLIYDFSMPDVDGVELCTWLRQKGHRVPVILISGFGADHPDLKRVLQLRKIFLLQKPFSFRDMSDLVTIAMGETLVG